jgi:hypothetical protein
VRGGMSSAEAKCAAAMEDVVVARAHKARGGGHGGRGGPSPCSQVKRQRPWQRWCCEPVLRRREAAAMETVGVAVAVVA